MLSLEIAYIAFLTILKWKKYNILSSPVEEWLLHLDYRFLHFVYEYTIIIDAENN